MPLITADNVSVRIGRNDILKNISFELPGNRFIGLLGPNGSGKTTLLRTLSGVQAYEGTLRLEGQPVRSWKPRQLARKLAFVRQTLPLSFDFSVLELVLLGRSPHKQWLQGYTGEDQARARAALDLVGLSDFYDRSVLTLSGGELQRVILAQTLVQETDVLLLDEPTAHLDVHHQFHFLNQVHNLLREGRSIIGVFHDLELAARYASILIIMHRGRVVATGAPPDVLTPALIADVFRMTAEVHSENRGEIRIHYIAPA